MIAKKRGIFEDGKEKIAITLKIDNYRRFFGSAQKWDPIWENEFLENVRRRAFGWASQKGRFGVLDFDFGHFGARCKIFGNFKNYF